MNKTHAIVFSLLCLPVFVLSQQSIKGYIVNSENNQPLSGSSIFLSNTSIGTVSDKSGYFELNNIPSGRYDLVVSSIGFETNVYSFSSGQLPLQVKVAMKVKIKELANVTVEPFVEEGWDKWGVTFMQDFIGSTPNAKQCRIKNESIIHFRYYKKSKRVVAYADEPIIIENKALGYNIRYQLEEFEVNFADGSSSYAGFPFFEEMDKGRKGLQRRWKEAREKAYFGSVMHFMRCLYRDSLAQNGYDVRRMIRTPNLEKERVERMYAAATKATVDPTTGRRTVKINQDELARDSTEYYQRILHQKDYIETYGVQQLTADSLLIQAEGAEKILFFTNYLYITYKGETEDKEYLLYHYENRSPTFQRSYIWLTNQQPVSVDMNGNYYPPQELFSMAYWAWSDKNADLLPQDYEP